MLYVTDFSYVCSTASSALEFRDMHNPEAHVSALWDTMRVMTGDCAIIMPATR